MSMFGVGTKKPAEKRNSGKGTLGQRVMHLDGKFLPWRALKQMFHMQLQISNWKLNKAVSKSGGASGKEPACQCRRRERLKRH